MRVFTPLLGCVWMSVLACHGGRYASNICGNGALELGNGEECDLGEDNQDEGACTLDCRLPRCGDGFIQALELCDDGPDNDDNSPCTPLCAPPRCGDGILQEDELCDDGLDNKLATNEFGGCSLDCAPLPVCGDGIVEPEIESCDDGNNIEDDDCTAACRLPACGDGIQHPGEECDDGNDLDNDACTTACEQAQCGDGIVWAEQEECDDGDDDNHDGCLSVCVKASCGDGVLYEGVEECDDGNLIEDDGCNAECFEDRLVFITDEAYGVTQINVLTYAYVLCAQQAKKHGLTDELRYRAWLSDGVSSPSNRFDHSQGRYVLVTGEVIAYGWDDLTDGELLHPIDRTAAGMFADEVPVWSATRPDGTPYDDGHCEGWSNNGDAPARSGFSDLSDAGWTSYISEFGPDCGSALNLYCFEARI